jgi:hypothetical protein
VTWTGASVFRLICLLAAVFLFLLWAFGAGPAWVEQGGFVAFALSFLIP